MEGHNGVRRWQDIRQNSSVVLLTIYANMGALMIGYDNLTLSVCLAMPSFQNMFGSPVDGRLVIPAIWQSLWNALFNIAILFGSICAGFIQDQCGRRSVFAISSIAAITGTALNFTANARGHFLAGKVVTGYGMGLIVTTAQTYISEITPLEVRSLCLSAYAIFLNLGLLVGISATFGRVADSDPAAFRVLFACAWIFPSLLLLGLPFVPESPYWLVLRGDTEKAEHELKRLRPHDMVSRELSQIVSLIDQERATLLEAGHGSYWDCFKGTDWQRTRINLLCNYTPQIVGATLASNAPYFLSQTGMAPKTITILIEIGVSLGVISSIATLWLLAKFKFRQLIFLGTSLCIMLFTAMGIAGCFPNNTKALWIVGITLQLVPLTYGFTIGSTSAIASEVSSARLRAKTIAIGQGFNSVASTGWLFALPYLFTSTEADLGGKIGWIFASMALVYLIWAYFDIPETKGLTFAELDTNFERKLAVRDWEKQTTVTTVVAV